MLSWQSGNPILSRREMLVQAGFGFGAWAMLDLLGAMAAGRSAVEASRIRSPPKPPHFPARAKHVIFLFMQGGPSHIDTFDPKPLLNERTDNPCPRPSSRVCNCSSRR